MMMPAFSHSQTPLHPTVQESSIHQQENPRSHLQQNGSTLKTKPRGRQISSRYLSPSPSPSPSSALISRSTNTTPTSNKTTSSSLPKRSQSVDRRRPGGQANNVNTKELSAAASMLITSTRSLSVSFQGETFSLPISKTKSQVGSTLTRKTTPDRRRATPGENSKPVNQHRWPGRTGQGNSGSNLLSRNLDYFGERKMLDERSRRISFDANSVNEASCDLSASDTDSVSSGTGSTNSEISKGRSDSRSILVSARFWQETNSRLRRLQDPGSPLSTRPGSRIDASAKFSQSKSFTNDGCAGAVSSPRTMGSPIRGGTRPASPGKLWTSSATSPFRGLSPARVRNALGGQMIANSVDTPSILSLSADIRRGKRGDNRIVDAHMLRLLYNSYLQWRFANARADTVFMVQELSAEKNLWDAWVTTSELQYSVTLKRMKLLLLRQKLKLTSILKGQISHLEAWALLDKDHSSSLIGATEALKASTLRLPIVGKAIADIQNLKDAVSSAVDVMHAMASSICSLSSKVKEINSLVDELATVAANERGLFEQCKDFLSVLAAIQVNDCSLRSHIIQLKHVPASGCLITHV